MNEPNIEQQAEDLLKKHGYAWCHALKAYRRTRQVRQESTSQYLAGEPVVVTFEELEDHNLIPPQFGPTGVQPTLAEKRANLQWLAERLEESSKR